MNPPNNEQQAAVSLTQLTLENEMPREQRDGCTCDCGSCPCGKDKSDNEEEASDAG